LKILGKQKGVNPKGIYGKICKWGEPATTK
jgi:hypothetical protein